MAALGIPDDEDEVGALQEFTQPALGSASSSAITPVRRPATNAVLTYANRTGEAHSRASSSNCAVPLVFTARASARGLEKVVFAAR